MASFRFGRAVLIGVPMSLQVDRHFVPSTSLKLTTSASSDILQDDRFGKDAKTLAGSVLAQKD